MRKWDLPPKEKGHLDPGKGCIQLLFIQNLLDAQLQILKPPVEGVARIALLHQLSFISNTKVFKDANFAVIFEVDQDCAHLYFIFCFSFLPLKVRAVGIEPKP